MAIEGSVYIVGRTREVKGFLIILITVVLRLFMSRSYCNASLKC